MLQERKKGDPAWFQRAAGNEIITKFVGGLNNLSKKPNMPLKLFPDKHKSCELVVALACIFASFDMDMVLGVGTANAASVGGGENICGHCYAVLLIYDARIRCMVAFIVEVSCFHIIISK